MACFAWMDVETGDYMVDRAASGRSEVAIFSTENEAKAALGVLEEDERLLWVLVEAPEIPG